VDAVITGITDKVFISNHQSNWMVVVATKDAIAIKASVLRHGPYPAVRRDTGAGPTLRGYPEVVFEDCRIPRGAGGREGEGFKITCAASIEPAADRRRISVSRSEPWMPSGVRAGRKAFGQAIAFQAIQFMLADMAIDLEAMRLLTYRAAWEIDNSGGSSIFSSYAKAFGADRAMKHAENAVQIFGTAERLSGRETDA
jgi:alkylation response protein AidB-like acyl-CoA dehydrogenase